MKKILQEQEQGRKELEEQQKAMEDNRRIRQELVLQQNTAKINYDRAKGDFLQNQDELEQIRLESQGIDGRKKEIESQLKELESALQKVESQNEDNTEKIKELNATLEQLKEQEKTLTEDNNKWLMEISSQSGSNTFLEQNMTRVSQSLQQLEEELKEQETGGRSARDMIAGKQRQIQEAGEQIQKTKQEITALEETIRRESEEKEKLSKQHKGFFEKREGLSDKISQLDRECLRLENQKEKLEETLNSRTTYMWEQYELTYHGAEELKTETELTPAQMKEQIASLKTKIKNLGDVNVNAIEQYQDVLERYTQLKTQHDDLEKATQVIQGVIAELDESMRKQFEEQFAEIRDRFDKVFKELFGGGRGTLELMEEEDILTAGIKIVAQPPGKKLQNMMQLSGGEKALTAIALLFAIQSLKPSPFCLLDEIEAALDDSNVSRYADYLHKLTKDTQFIVITHRRGTMNAADILYGITMQEKGVSTLVSVNLLEEKDIVN
jgi:chromosome segregation protein